MPRLDLPPGFHSAHTHCPSQLALQRASYTALHNMNSCPFSAVFDTGGSYDHKDVESDGECYICREPFSTDDDGCHAIQLNQCGHVVGHECFRQWSARVPNVCPYYSHHLPFTSRTMTDEAWTVAALRYACSSGMFIWVNSMLLDAAVITFLKSTSRAESNAIIAYSQKVEFTAAHRDLIQKRYWSMGWRFLLVGTIASMIIIPLWIRLLPTDCIWHRGTPFEFEHHMCRSGMAKMQVEFCLLIFCVHSIAVFIYLYVVGRLLRLRQSRKY